MILTLQGASGRMPKKPLARRERAARLDTGKQKKSSVFTALNNLHL
nr:MAG TPA: hypothetical protein [Caudoviricetes sp.]